MMVTQEMGLSRTIIESPVILFLGAGASQPLDKPLMGPFVRRLLVDWKSRETYNLLFLLTKLVGDDLESILGELDAILGLSHISSVSLWYEQDFLSIDAERGRKLRTEIEYEIIQQYSSVPRDTVQELYKPLLEKIFSRIDPEKHCLPIFTTNYDPAIEDFCAAEEAYHLTDGFRDSREREYIWTGDDFDGFELVSGKRNIVLFKLHGSVNWVHVASSGRIIRTQPFHQRIDPQQYRNVLIYPAMRKIAIDNPYFGAYEYYLRCCEEARACLTIGYSFRDYDALTRLRGAMSVNPDLRVMLLSPSASKVLHDLPIHNSRLEPIDFSFGDAQRVAAYLAGIEKLIS